MVAFILILLLSGTLVFGDIVVNQYSSSFEEVHVLQLNSTIEYLLDFTPNSEQQQYPSLLRVEVDGGDITHPVFITARTRKRGAISLQLPYVSGERALYSLERILCPYEDTDDVSDCAGNETIRHGFSLHIGTTCVVPINLTLLVTPAREWRLPFDFTTTVHATQLAPQVRFYEFLEDQNRVHVAVSADDNVCALISVQNYTCPVLQTEADVYRSGLRMTMLKSAGIYLQRSLYPKGFYIIVIVKPSDEDCNELITSNHNDWQEPPTEFSVEFNNYRTKDVNITVKATLTKGQYAIATTVTFLIFIMFYVGFLTLVFAQRWPCLGNHVAPMAVAGDNTSREEINASTLDMAESPARGRRDRKSSTATFDSSDNSDSDDEEVQERSSPAEQTTEHTNTIQVNGEAASNQNNERPFGLPPHLSLAALSRRHSRVLRARSDRYLHMLYTVAVFYALPVLQFVSAFQIFLNISGSLDVCYYNFLCSHPLGQLSDFNHVFSNIGYLLLGALFLIQVRRRRKRRELTYRSEEYGIPAHFGLLSSLGAGMMVVALLSASYHVCPNRLNFQFDTAFMYVLSVISMVKIYQSRHPDVNARAHATFGILAVLMAFVVWGVLGGGPFFWIIFTIVHIFAFLLLSLRIYYVGQFRFEKQTIQMAAREIVQMPKLGVRPLYKTRLVMLLIANVVNWMFAFYSLWAQTPDFASHLLKVLLGNTLIYMIFYITMKLLHGERPRWYAWCYLGGAFVSWLPSLYFFVSGSSDWSTTPALSRHSNHECYVLNFYDSHDLWHMLSAVSLYLSFNAMMTWDDGLGAVKRTDIAVF